MKEIYKYIADSDAFHSVMLQDSDAAIRRLIAKSKKVNGPLEVLTLSEYSVGQKGDFPSLCGWIPVFSHRAWTNLKEFLGGTVQAIPASCNSETYFLINVLNVVPCLDTKASTIVRNSVTGQVSSIRNPSFDTEMLDGQYIFRIPETQDLEVYFTSEFSDLVAKKGLMGLCLERQM